MKKKTRDEINSSRPTRYIADTSESDARRKDGNMGERMRLATVLGAKPPSFEATHTEWDRVPNPFTSSS